MDNSADYCPSWYGTIINMRVIKAISRVPRLSVVFMISVSPYVVAGPDAFIDIDASIGLDDNVTRAQENIDIEHDTFVSALGTFNMNLYRGRSGALNGSAKFGVNHSFNFDGLSHYSLSGALDYNFAFSSSFGAPWYGVGLSYTVKEFDSFLRDSDIYNLSGTFGKQLDDLTNLRIGVSYKVRESEGIVFDTEDASIFFNVDFSLPDNYTLYTTYKLQEGDTFSTASAATVTTSGPGTIGLALSSASIPKETDDVFANEIVYQLDSTTHIITLGLNLKRSLHNAYDVSFRFLKSDTDVGLEYEDFAVRLSYFHKFGVEF